MTDYRWNTRAEALEEIASMDWPDSGVTASLKFHKAKRTHSQNAALHVLFRQMAEELNEAGLDMRAVFSKMKLGVDMPWTENAVKESIWRPIQRSMTGKDSTTEITKMHPGDIYEVMARFFSERFGYAVPPFPTKRLCDERY